MIIVSKLYEIYLDTLGRCTSGLLVRSDADIGYELFEEFAVGAVSFLHHDSLARLRDAGFIDDEIADASHELREEWLALEELPSTISEIRTQDRWLRLFALSDRVRSLVIRRNSSQSAPSIPIQLPLKHENDL